MVLDRLTPQDNSGDGARDRRAARLPPQSQFDRRLEARADRVSGE